MKVIGRILDIHFEHQIKKDSLAGDVSRSVTRSYKVTALPSTSILNPDLTTSSRLTRLGDLPIAFEWPMNHYGIHGDLTTSSHWLAAITLSALSDELLWSSAGLVNQPKFANFLSGACWPGPA